MIVLCVTGSVAVSQAVKVAREFRRQGQEVKCFMSEAACEILHPKHYREEMKQLLNDMLKNYGV